MLKSFEAEYRDGRLFWTKDAPEVQTAKVLVTLLEEEPETAEQIIERRRKAMESLKGKMTIIGDIVAPVFDEADWSGRP